METLVSMLEEMVLSALNNFGKQGLGYDSQISSCPVGVPVVDTTNGRLQVLYYPIGDFFTDEVDSDLLSTLFTERADHGCLQPFLLEQDNYDKTVDCWNTYGYEKCTHLAQVWLNETLV